MQFVEKGPLSHGKSTTEVGICATVESGDADSTIFGRTWAAPDWARPGDRVVREAGIRRVERQFPDGWDRPPIWLTIAHQHEDHGWLLHPRGFEDYQERRDKKDDEA